MATQHDPAWTTPVPLPANGKVYQAESTRKMGALIERIYRDSDWKTDPTKQAQRASYYTSLLANHLSFPDEATIRQQLAIELLGAGDSEAAVNDLEALRALSLRQQQAGKPTLPPLPRRRWASGSGLRTCAWASSRTACRITARRPASFPFAGLVCTGCSEAQRRCPGVYGAA